MSKIVLVVDDSTSIRKMIAFTLKCAGYTVIEAVDGKDALEKAKTNTFHMVLTDVNMPEMDGLVLTRSLRMMPQYKGIPIIVITTEASEAMKSLGNVAGATGWIVKPIDPEKILEVTRQLTN